MDASISASLGAMGSLIRKLDMLLGEATEDDPGDPYHRLRLRLRFKDGVALVHLLRMDLEEISTYLEDLSEVEDPPLTAKCWMKEVRELSYDIEDYIDSFVRPARNTNIKTRSRSISKISHVELAHLPKKKLRYKRASNKISDFIIRAHDGKQRYTRYELDWHNLRRRYVPVGPMRSTPYQESTDLVIDGQMSNLIGTLASDGDHQLKVVSILGSGGIGKTTLVRVLYNKIRRQFQLRAFIQMTRKPDVKIVLRQLLTQIQRQQSHEHCEDLDLISKVRKHLQNKRYLIIVDDLWSPSEWNIINHAFPEGTQHSRIIVTTQIEDVALTCCSYHSGFVHEMRPQDFFSSRKLFFTKVFGSESESDCPDTFKEASNKIIKICGGLPLATVTMASLLSSYPVVLIEQWAYISDLLSSNLRTSPTTEVVRQVLNISYNNLTHYLKTCLLYLNMYPEGYTICKDDLVKQWVAEGFIDATEGRDMERVARSYFDELIDRRFLQPACIKFNNAMVSCTVHDTVRDLIAYKSLEENFVMVVDNYRKNVELCDKVHRLSLQFDETKHAKKPADIILSQVRSLFFFGLFRCMPSIRDFKLLRVLNLQLSGHHGGDVFDLTGVSELFHLRYLKVASDVCIELPKHMQGLQYLETLDIDAELTAVPWDIIHLPCLLHLHLPFETNLMDWIGSMRFESVQKLGKLTNLRDFRLTCSTTPPLDHLEQNMEALGSLLTVLGNLNRLTLVCGSFRTNAVVGSPSNVTISWDGFSSPLLQRFEWSTICCTFSRVPKWTGEFGNLRVLKITVKELLRDGVEILKGLPALTTLSIYVLAEPVAMTIFDKAGFSVLTYFKYRCSAPRLKFEVGAMPNLCKLKLGFNAHRVDQHDSTHISIDHLPGLQEISVKMGGAGADAESDLAAAIINHPSNPQIDMQLVDWIFYGFKVTEKKAHGRIEKHVLMEETRDEVSRDDMGKQTEGEAQGIIYNDVLSNLIDNDATMKGTEYSVSGKGEDENEQTGERKRRRIERDDIMKKMEDENKQEIISNFTPSVPSPHLPQLDIEQILNEAQYRWLRPAEICEILKNYRNFRIAPEPPNRPPSGSLYLFDRKVLRYFRKDGHNWRKKNDKKTVKEAHERLKSGSIDVLHCYYAHGEENINFQRRTYWMLEEDYMHIVLVHYLETKGKGKLFGARNMIQEAAVHSPCSLSGQASEYSSVTSFFKPASSIVTSAQGLGDNYLTPDEVYHELSSKAVNAAEAVGESFCKFSSATGDLSATENSLLLQNDGSLEVAFPFLDTGTSILKDTFKKSDSFTRWMSKELSEVEDLQIQSSSEVYWSTEEADSIIDEASSLSSLDQFTVSLLLSQDKLSLDQSTVSPMLSQDKLFNIVDFAPSWTYVGSKTRILVAGNILNNSHITERYKWSCMFGEVEVPAEVLADGSLICYSPQHKPGRVPFYITCSNRLACSEVREFEFRPTVSQYMDAPSPHGETNKAYFQIRLDKLLSLGPDEYQATVANPSLEMIDLSKKISSLMTSNDEWSNLLKLAVDNEPSTADQQDQFAENLIKEKLCVWLLNKVGMGGKGPSVLDDEGQGVLHLAAALGYDWAIRPTIAAGMNINFRDVHGWTALHWAAFCGRERTVVALIALGAAPGALTDPTPDFPGSTPADLASANGQKGISGFLAESSLTSHLQALNLKEANLAQISGLPGIGDVTERDSLQPPSGDSLGPVRNAAQAAAQIFQFFRVQSFQRKQAAQYEDDKGGMSDERALSLLSIKPPKSEKLDPLHSAATHIQNKFRGWKRRKDFLLIRQRIVKIQAHVRGHQVRKLYRKIIWSVGIVEKVILRWRRRGAGLRGFRSTEGSVESSSGTTSRSSIQDKPSGDNYDFLQEGRKQTEERLQKALARVKSMAQYPEAKHQYQRILTVVSKMQESQAMQEKMLEPAEMDFMSEFKELWDDDTPIPGYF